MNMQDDHLNSDGGEEGGVIFLVFVAVLCLAASIGLWYGAFHVELVSGGMGTTAHVPSPLERQHAEWKLGMLASASSIGAAYSFGCAIREIWIRKYRKTAGRAETV